MLPQRALAALAVLQAEGLLVCAGGEGFVLLAPCAGGRVDALELRDRERRFGGILAGKVRVKVGKTRLFILQLRHDEAHLQSPVAQVDIADHMVAEEAVDPLERFADDGAAQMADVQGLCHVRPAVVQHDRAGVRIVLHAVVRVRIHAAQIGGQILIRDLQIQKARHHGLGAGKHLVFAQRFEHGVRNLDGRLVVFLRRGQRAGALVLAEVGAVGKRHLAVGRVESGPLKRARQLLRDQIDQKFHVFHPSSCHKFHYYSRKVRECTETPSKKQSYA